MRIPGGLSANDRVTTFENQGSEKAVQVRVLPSGFGGRWMRGDAYLEPKGMSVSRPLVAGFRPIAQVVERRILVPEVVGASPTRPVLKSAKRITNQSGAATMISWKLETFERLSSSP